MTIVRRLPAAVRGVSLSAVAGLSLLVLMSLPACQNTDNILKPGDVEVDVMRAVYIPDSIFLENPIELNGEALEREWGGPLDSDLPFHQIRVSAEEGSGDAGVPAYVSAKCLYTDSDIYFLLRWTDPVPNEASTPLVYVGPNYDSRDDCAPYLNAESSWIRTEELEEDRLVIQFDMPDVEGASSGRRDVWQWLAARTNVVRNLYDLEENPYFPIRGYPAYMEDAIYDPGFGLFFDPGSPTWRRNYATGSAVPTFVYRQKDDPFFEPLDGDLCRNGFGGPCLANNGLSFYYLWREDLTATTEHFESCDSLNYFPNNLVDDSRDGEPRFWKTFDAVSSYWYTYPEGSRADVRAKAVWKEGVWTLEGARSLRTADLANDLAFPSQTGGEAGFTIQVYDGSTSVYRGSSRQVVRFVGPRTVGFRGRGEESR